MICKTNKLGDAMFDEDDIFSPPRFDVQICYNDCMPTIYDDYNDESGFGEVVTCLVMNPPFWMRPQLTMITRLLCMMIMVMTCMLQRIMITMKLVIMILVSVGLCLT